MKKSRILLGAIVPLLTAGVVWIYGQAEGSEAPAYRFAEVTRGDLEAAVSATGALGAVTTVQVGTQVSGQVAAIHVDFNDTVKKGQLIARIDPTLQQQSVRDAEAGFERAQAELVQAQRDYERNQQLFEQRALTESEHDAAEYKLAVARASSKSAQVTVDRARQNLSYTSIYAPINGIVVERNVDVGQTVAASLSAPQLFLIANTLARMQILASVDESDIGVIKEGQPVRFRVQAYPNESFTGTVRQVRLQSRTLENVVNYTAVVEVENPSGKLLPGMTATVEFLTETASDAFLVPNAALRFRPADAALPVGGSQQSAAASGRGTGVPSAQPRTARARSAPTGARTGVAQSANSGMVWYQDKDGTLKSLRIRIGITDGQKTVIRGEGITEGMRIIVGASQVAQTGASPTATASSPFQAQTQGGGPPRPGSF
ncbi:MAG: efflux RND transporter periplasmic adaptor subunit [Anaerolineae bacterium]|nr:efflux RND transporter periplasmic adaptor subunit [Gemmatimonadaceae bacterium]